MEIVFNENKKSYLDKESLRILGMMVKVGKNVKEDELGVKAYNGDICIGLKYEDCTQFSKIVDSIYKEKSVSKFISQEFIYKQCLMWLVYKYNKATKQKFSDFIKEKLEESVKTYYFHFPVLHLDFSEYAPMVMGNNATLHYFGDNHFDVLSVDFEKKYPNEKENNPYIALKEKYRNQLMITYPVTAEKIRGEEIAFTHCSLAVDILKILSEVHSSSPASHVSFDIDRRVKELSKSEMMYQLQFDNNSIRLEVKKVAHEHKIRKDDSRSEISSRFNLVNGFLFRLDGIPNELNSLLINNIRRYANALSNPDLHQRVVEIFTIFESLLLKDENASILDSICKYAPKLIFQKAAISEGLMPLRKAVVKLLKGLYQVRSAMIHHGEKKPFPLEDLRMLQISVLSLILGIAQKSKTHTTKMSLLTEIDEAIIDAY